MKQILKNKIYYTRTGGRHGSVRLVQGFDTCKYLLLHNKQQYLMFKLNGIASRLFTGKRLADKGFSVGKPIESIESYLAYDLASFEPFSFENIEMQNAIINGFGNRTADSYFTTLKQLFGL